MKENLIDGLVKQRPLIKFSIYSVRYVEIVQRLSSQIRTTLDEAFCDGTVHASAFQRFYDMFWLWVLGTYEIVRTMDQAKGSFSAAAGARIRVFKRRIAKLRMPFAKLEYAGRATPIINEASVCGIDALNSDVTFEVEREVFSVRALLKEFDGLIAGISVTDVLGRRDAASRAKGHQR